MIGQIWSLIWIIVSFIVLLTTIAVGVILTWALLGGVIDFIKWDIIDKAKLKREFNKIKKESRNDI